MNTQLSNNPNNIMTQKAEQQKQATAKTKRTLSTSTGALITAKCALIDLYSDIVNAIVLVYGDQATDRCTETVGEALAPIRDLVDRYLIESIDCNINDLDSTEY